MLTIKYFSTARKIFYPIRSIDIFEQIKNVLFLEVTIFNIPKMEISHYTDCFIIYTSVAHFS